MLNLFEILIFVAIITPIERTIYKRINKKWLAYILTVLCGAPILLGVHALDCYVARLLF